MGGWRREGECRRCGVCCKTLVSAWYMTGYPKEGTPERLYGCIYLEEEGDGTYSCLIQSEDFDYDSLSEKVKNYFEVNCRDYPDPKKPGHTPPIFTLLPGCGFVITRVEDDAISD